MLRPTEELPISEEPYDSAREAVSDPAHERANFFWLALHQVIVRIGWIFKTESIVMPAFLDYIGGGPVLRGFLPVLNRFGFSIPPVLYARRLKRTPIKKWHLARNSLALSLPFAILSVLWASGVWHTADGQVQPWVPVVVLALYGIFFCLMGMNQLSTHVLTGKLIRATLRGRLMSVSICVGSPLAIAAAWFLMRDWLATPDQGFVGIFAATAIAFAAASVTLLPVRETPDAAVAVSNERFRPFVDVWRLLADDVDFRRLALVAALFGASFMLFPHYQTLGRDRLGLGYDDLVLWLCVQNVAVAVGSLVMGPLADRCGNRLALRLALVGCAATPLLAAWLARWQPEVGHRWFWLVFATTGMTPVAIKLLSNYTLEIALREHHPRYVSTIGLCLAAPVMVGAPLAGWLIGQLGYEPVLVVGGAMIGLAAVLTFRMIEPRQRNRAARVSK